ncbi:MAG: hypothetical protein HYW34_01780 [Candidatus Brennerbacteria bacterium]|nr:hypothetical protein [Candidatus Brennerbacteria bacterium]
MIYRTLVIHTFPRSEYQPGQNVYYEGSDLAEALERFTTHLRCYDHVSVSIEAVLDNSHVK